MNDDAPIKQALDGLLAARKLIGKEKRWTSKASARSRSGAVVSVNSPRARMWCAFGALRREVGSGTIAFQVADDYLSQESMRLYGMTYVDVNDGEDGYQRVLHVMDETIERVRGLCDIEDSS